MTSKDRSGDIIESALDGKPTENSGKSRWSEQLWEMVYLFLPDSIKKIIEKKLLRAAAFLFVLIVFGPLLITLLAAFWLKQLGNIDYSLVRTMRTEYLEIINGGFSIEEVASRSNARLDYLQLFDYDLRPKTAPSKDLRISLLPRQKAAVDFRWIEFHADDLNCSVTEYDDDVALVSVWLDDKEIGTLRKEGNKTIEIGKTWWEANRTNFEPDSPIQRLSFKLTDKARQFTCGRVHIEGSVRVFKDLVPLQSIQG